MVLVEGLRWAKVTGLALLQSRYSVASWVAQKSRSWSSELNVGIALFAGILINSPLAPTHLSG